MPVLAGVLCEVGATIVGTAGKQMVSHAGRIGKSDPRHRQYKAMGLALTTLVGPVADMAAYAMAPQSLLAPLIGLDIVWNTISAPYTLGERLRRKHVLGSGLVFLGASLSAVFGQHHEGDRDIEWLHSIFLSWRFLSYCAAFAALLVVSFTVLQRNPPESGTKARGVALGLTAGAIAGNMFFMSAGLGMLTNSIETGDWANWADWLPYPVLLCGILVAVGNIPLMTRGLEEYEALFMVTVFEGAHICTASITSIWVLQEMRESPWPEFLSYLACVALIVAGLTVIQGAAVADEKAQELQKLNEPREWELHPEDSSESTMATEEEEEEEEGELQLEEQKREAELQQTKSPRGSPVMWTSMVSGKASVTDFHIVTEGEIEEQWCA